MSIVPSISLSRTSTTPSEPSSRGGMFRTSQAEIPPEKILSGRLWPIGRGTAALAIGPALDLLDTNIIILAGFGPDAVLGPRTVTRALSPGTAISGASTTRPRAEPGGSSGVQEAANRERG